MRTPTPIANDIILVVHSQSFKAVYQNIKIKPAKNDTSSNITITQRVVLGTARLSLESTRFSKIRTIVFHGMAPVTGE